MAGQSDAIGGAVEIVDCDVGDVEINHSQQVILAAIVETMSADAIDVTAHWVDHQGRGVQAPFSLHPGSRRLRTSVDHQTALESWGRGTHQLHLVIELAPGEVPPPHTSGAPNDPKPCGAITVR